LQPKALLVKSAKLVCEKLLQRTNLVLSNKQSNDFKTIGAGIRQLSCQFKTKIRPDFCLLALAKKIFKLVS